MTLAMRDQRIRLYTLTEVGADGWTRPVYVAFCNAWARVEPPSGSDLARFEGTEHTVTVVATMDLGVGVPVPGMVRVLPGTDGLSDYRIVAVLPRRLTNEQLVYCASMAQDEKPHEVDDTLAEPPVATITIDEA